MNLDNFRFYPVNFEKDPVLSGYSVIVRGHKGATDGSTLEEAQQMAKEFIFDVSFFDFDDRKIFTGAGQAEEGDQIIDVGIDAALKLMLRNLLVQANVSQGELGRRLGLSKTSISSVINPRKSTRLSTLAQCFDILGSPLKISC